MRTKTALALSIAGILLTGTAALATNAPILINSSSEAPGSANKLLPDDSATSTPTAPSPGLSAAARTPKPTATGTPGDDGKASPHATSSAPAAASVEPGDDKGGQQTTPEPGDDNGGLRPTRIPPAAEARDDKGGLRNALEPGDDKGGHGGHGSDD